MPSSEQTLSRNRITVVGAGIVGLSIALRLHLDGFAVTVIDQREPMSACSAGNAGYLSEANIFPPASRDLLQRLPFLMWDRDSPLVIRPSYVPALLRWAIPALKFSQTEHMNDVAASMAALLRIAYDSFEELTSAANASHLLDRRGGLVACKTQQGLQAKSKHLAIWNQFGLVAERISSDDVAQLEPALAAMHGGVYFPNAGRCIDPRRLGQHYAQCLVDAGVRIIRQQVRRIEQLASGAARLHLEDKTWCAPRLVIATGFDTTLIRPLLDFHVPMVAERGYHLMLPEPGVNLCRPVVFGEPMFAATSMQEGLRLAGTAEFAHPDAKADMRRAHMLLRLARDYLPGINDAKAKPWMGVRPTLPDGRPAIGQIGHARNIYYAIGHSHNGLTTSAVTARCLASLIQGRQAPVDLRPFSIERFR
jgi:glycine/D-amino acid oxidase-like deaminating enzyme